MPKQTTITLGEQIQLYRKRKHLSQTELSEKTGLSRAIISLIERNEGNPSIGTLEKIATALDTQLICELSENK